MIKSSSWDIEEVKTLFKFVEVEKSEGKSLVKAFADYSEFTKRQKNSVRNFYYKQLAEFEKNKDLASSLKIDLNNHIVTKGLIFTKEEEEKMLDKISNMINSGYSVRRACLELSGGDIKEMLRLQNKYRAITKNNQKESGFMGKIIKMPQKSNKLTEEDLRALFLGVVNLIKRQETENAKSYYEPLLFSANEKLKNAIKELEQKQNQIEKLKNEIHLIKNKTIQKVENNKNTNTPISKSASIAIKEYFAGKDKMSQEVQ